MQKEKTVQHVSQLRGHAGWSKIGGGHCGVKWVGDMLYNKMHTIYKCDARNRLEVCITHTVSQGHDEKVEQVVKRFLFVESAVTSCNAPSSSQREGSNCQKLCPNILIELEQTKSGDKEMTWNEHDWVCSGMRRFSDSKRSKEAFKILQMLWIALRDFEILWIGLSFGDLLSSRPWPCWPCMFFTKESDQDLKSHGFARRSSSHSSGVCTKMNEHNQHPLAWPRFMSLFDNVWHISWILLRSVWTENPYPTLQSQTCINMHTLLNHVAWPGELSWIMCSKPLTKYDKITPFWVANLFFTSCCSSAALERHTTSVAWGAHS